MNVHDTGREKQKAKAFFDTLSPSDLWELGDQLVLGDFDWRDWFHTKPSSVLLNEVDALRIHWEVMS